jgi:hypothetical protein
VAITQTDIDFHAFVSEVLQRKANVIEGQQELYLRYPNMLVAVKFSQEPEYI